MTSSSALTGRCDCGAVTIAIPGLPDSINACPCDYCRRVGARWGYFPAGAAEITGPTESYERAARVVAFHRCTGCGTLTHWIGKRPGGPVHMGVHMENFDPALLADVPAVVDP